MEGLYLLIRLLLSHLSSSTFKGDEPLGWNNEFPGAVSGSRCRKSKLQNMFFPTQPLLVILVVPTPLKSFGQVGGNLSHCLQGEIQLWVEIQMCGSLSVHVSTCNRCLNSYYILWRETSQKSLDSLANMWVSSTA